MREVVEVETDVVGVDDSSGWWGGGKAVEQ